MYRSCVLCIVGHPVVPIAAIAIGGMYGPTTSVHLCGLHAEGPREVVQRDPRSDVVVHAAYC